MEYLMEQRVIPFLRERFGLREVIKAKVLKTCAIGESTIDDRITDLMKSVNPTVGLAAHPAQTDVRITAKAESEQEADRLIAEMEAVVRERLGEAIYGVDKQRLEEVVVELMAKAGVTVSVLETMSRGSVARRLLSVPNGKEYLKNSHVFEATGMPEEIKEKLATLLGIARETLAEVEWPGEKLAALTAQALREVETTDLGLVVIGLGEIDESSYAPVTGSIWCALATAKEVVTRPFHYGGEADTLVPWVSGMALDILRRGLLGRNQHPDY
jgi:nicotinamide-nucleotide amidase